MLGRLLARRLDGAHVHAVDLDRRESLKEMAPACEKSVCAEDARLTDVPIA